MMNVIEEKAKVELLYDADVITLEQYNKLMEDLDAC